MDGIMEHRPVGEGSDSKGGNNPGLEKWKKKD